MSNAFSERTFSTDWEVMAMDRLARFVNDKSFLGVAGILSEELRLPVHVDWNALEFGLGVNRSLNQARERLEKLTDRASQLLRDLDVDLWPVGANPVEGPFNAAHVHVGTLFSETLGICVENRMVRYTPAFAALAANSPYYARLSGEYKSYRVRNYAWDCTRPVSVRDPWLAQQTWGGDASPKLYGAPTFEVRITDCASSRRFLAELMVFIAAFVHLMGQDCDDYRPSREEYVDSLTNRWLAAKYGMQATFLWEGAARPVSEILDEMLDACPEQLAALGATRQDLSITGKMIEKRLCQADSLMWMADRYPDPIQLAVAQVKLLRGFDYFDDYAVNARPLEPVAAPTQEEIEDAHISVIGDRTHFAQSTDVMSYPPPVTEAMIDRMVACGRLERELSEHGNFLSRRT